MHALEVGVLVAVLEIVDLDQHHNLQLVVEAEAILEVGVVIVLQVEAEAVDRMM